MLGQGCCAVSSGNNLLDPEVCLLSHHVSPVRFYQHVPDSAQWTWGLLWGHATSTDLVTWRHHTPALVPTPGHHDQDGCFSGCATLDDEGRPVLLYTGMWGSTTTPMPCGAHTSCVLAIIADTGRRVGYIVTWTRCGSADGPLKVIPQWHLALHTCLMPSTGSASASNRIHLPF